MGTTQNSGNSLKSGTLKEVEEIECKALENFQKSFYESGVLWSFGDRIMQAERWDELQDVLLNGAYGYDEDGDYVEETLLSCAEGWIEMLKLFSKAYSDAEKEIKNRKAAN